MHRRLEIARLLLDRGARVTAHGVGGYAALHMAAGTGDIRMLRLLLERGADVVEPAAVRCATKADPPAGLACSASDTPLRALPAPRSQDGTTPIAVAIREEQEKAQRLLEGRIKRRKEQEKKARLERRLGWMYEGEEEVEEEEVYARGLR